MRILGVSGSLKDNSSNSALLHRAAALSPAGVRLTCFDGLGDLPHFNPDLDEERIAALTLWRHAIDESDGLFITCPEYGFSLPGVLKNGIDWVIGSGELEAKLVCITCSSGTAERGQKGLDALMQTLSAVKAHVVGGHPTVRGPDEPAALRQLLAEMHAHGAAIG